MTNLFLRAAKRKYRFQTSKGLLNTEQLYDLGKQGLHDLYLLLESKMEKSKGLLGRVGNTVVEDKLEIVRAVFNDIVEDQNKEMQKLENKKRKEILLEAADGKEFEELTKGKTSKQLRRMAEKVGKEK